jgi:hypothetical protein
MNTTAKNALVIAAVLCVPLALSKMAPASAMVAIAICFIAWVATVVIMGDR